MSGDRNKDLTDEEIMDMAVEAVREARRKLREARLTGHTA